MGEEQPLAAGEAVTRHRLTFAKDVKLTLRQAIFAKLVHQGSPHFAELSIRMKRKGEDPKYAATCKTDTWFRTKRRKSADVIRARSEVVLGKGHDPETLIHELAHAVHKIAEPNSKNEALADDWPGHNFSWSACYAMLYNVWTGAAVGLKVRPGRISAIRTDTGNFVEVTF